MAWLYKQKGSANWWLGYRIHGKQVLRSTRTADESKARQELHKAELLFNAHAADVLTSDLYAALTGTQRDSVSLKWALEDWLKECETTTRPGTLARYRSIVNAVLTFFNAADSMPLLGRVRTEELRRFLLFKREKNSTSTVNMTRKVLSVFFLRAIRNGLLHANPMVAIRPFKSTRLEETSRRAFTVDELRLIYTKAPDDFWRFMVLAGFFTGQRMGDLITLKWVNVDFAQNQIRLRSSKTGTNVRVPMAQPLREFVADLTARTPTAVASDYLFPGRAQHYLDKGAGMFSNAFYDVLTQCGLVVARPKSHKKSKNGRDAVRNVGNVGFHCLRHTFVSYLKMTGGNQAVAKELAGHSSDLISDLYTHLPADTLAAAIQGLPIFGTERSSHEPENLTGTRRKTPVKLMPSCPFEPDEVSR